jgi:hypothetical protein
MSPFRERPEIRVVAPLRSQKLFDILSVAGVYALVLTSASAIAVNGITLRNINNATAIMQSRISARIQTLGAEPRRVVCEMAPVPTPEVHCHRTLLIWNDPTNGTISSRCAGVPYDGPNNSPNQTEVFEYDTEVPGCDEHRHCQFDAWVGIFHSPWLPINTRNQ